MQIISILQNGLYPIISRNKNDQLNSSFLGAVHMSRANPANRADLSHENLYFSTT